MERGGATSEGMQCHSSAEAWGSCKPVATVSSTSSKHMPTGMRQPGKESITGNSLDLVPAPNGPQSDLAQGGI